MKLAIALALVSGACAANSTAMKPPSRFADAVLVGGTVVTMDPLRPQADGLAIIDGHIDTVGSAADIRARIGPQTKVIELRGRSVVPGLVDAHCHLYGLGKALEILDLRGLTSIQAIVERVTAAAATRPASEWIEGRGWDQNLWTEKEFPTGGALDRVANPVSLRRIDGHSLWANAAAMRAAGVTRETKDPHGGRIIRDGSGAPTGVFVDAAMAIIDQRIPEPDEAAIRRRLEAAERVAVAQGLTGVHEMGIEDDVVAVYRTLEASGALKLRVYALLTGPPHVGELATRRPDVDPTGTKLFVLGGVKLYADGSLGSRSAALLAPYGDDPKNDGIIITDEPALVTAARAALAGGWQMAVHAIGDRANRNVLDAYREARVPPERRFRIEHAQVVAPADIPRFAAQGVIASMQPTHATSDMPWAEARVGGDRIIGAYAWRSLVASGAHVAFGSDFPVEEVPPLWGLWAVVSRQDRDGKPAGGWHPEQRLGLDEAIHAYTVEPAFAAFQEQHRGRIAPGFVADLTVFDRVLLADHLLDAKVAMTLVGGAVVYDGPATGR